LKTGQVIDLVGKTRLRGNILEEVGANCAAGLEIALRFSLVKRREY